VVKFELGKVAKSSSQHPTSQNVRFSPWLYEELVRKALEPRRKKRREKLATFCCTNKMPDSLQQRSIPELAPEQLQARSAYGNEGSGLLTSKNHSNTGAQELVCHFQYA
jgi:hypothetical protein